MNNTDKEILQFEHLWQGPEGKKMEQVMKRFNISETRYYQIIVRLTSDPDAYAMYPNTIKRLTNKINTRQERVARGA